MNKSDLVKVLAMKFSEVEARDTEFAVRLIFEAMTSALINGHRIEIRNFGVLKSRTRKSVLYKNPRNGNPIQKDSVRTIGFRMGKALRNKMDRIPNPGI